MLEARVVVPDRDVRADLAVPDGRTVAVVGPNGAGKSTLLQAVAGLLPARSGRVELGGQVVQDQDRCLPPHRRRTALLEQQPLLFDHLCVLDNVAFAPRARGLRKPAARGAARHWLDVVGAAALAGRRPRTLSGGQAQRVALARALAAEPALLLLDEPLAALDVDAAGDLRALLQQVLAGRTCLLVTHEVLDVLLLADDLVVLDGGAVVEAGNAHAVLARPRSAFAAGLAGLNRLTGVVAGSALLHTAAGPLPGTTDEPLAPGTAAVAVFAPAAVRLDPGGLPATVARVEPRGTQVRLRMRTTDAAADLSAEVPAADARAFPPGTAVRWSVPADAVHLVAASSRS
jgi:molybdate transport system ATP-binding protein